MSDSSLNDRINEHRHPAWMYRYPGTVRLLWIWFEVLYQRTWLIRGQLGRFLRKTEPRRVLDAGCGEGLFLLPAARRYAHHDYTGVDLRAANVELCTRYREHYRLDNLRVQQGDLTQLHVRPADLILCVGVLHCIPQDERALEEFSRNLSSGGTLLLYTPLERRRVLPGFDRLFNSTNNYEAHHAQHVYTDRTLTQKIERAGLQVSSRHYTNGTLGIIAYELITGAFLLTGRPNLLVKLLGWVLFVLVLPVQILLNLVDYWLPKNRGNGCLYVLKQSSKKGAPSV